MSAMRKNSPMTACDRECGCKWGGGYNDPVPSENSAGLEQKLGIIKDRIFL